MFRTTKQPKFSEKQIMFGLAIKNLTKKQFTLLMIFICFHKKYRVIKFGQHKQAKRAKCHRVTVHRAMKKFQELGWIDILSGLDPINDAPNGTNIYTASSEFDHFIQTTDIRHLLNYLKWREKNKESKMFITSDLQRQNATPYATQINTNSTSFHPYQYSNRNFVQNSEILGNPITEINWQLKELPLSLRDKLYFSRYSDAVIAQAMEKAKWIGQKYRMRSTLGAFLNTTCRKIARQR